MIAVAMARWHIGQLRRDQMLKTIGEYKVVYEEQDRLMVRLRESIKLAEAKTADLAERLRRQEEQCDYLLRRHYRWTRYVGGLQQQLRGAGLDVPDLPAEDEKS